MVNSASRSAVLSGGKVLSMCSCLLCCSQPRYFMKNCDGRIYHLDGCRPEDAIWLFYLSVFIVLDNNAGLWGRGYLCALVWLGMLVKKIKETIYMAVPSKASSTSSTVINIIHTPNICIYFIVKIKTFMFLAHFYESSTIFC